MSSPSLNKKKGRTMSATTWPEQDAIDEWWREHSLALKRAASAYRIERDQKINRLYEVVLMAINQCDAGEAEMASTTLKEALHEFNPD
jgi:hypothetical protein